MQDNQNIHIQPFGKLSNGHETKLFTLTNANGVSVGLSNYGARVVSFTCPDQNNNYKDIVLGFDNVKDYENSGAYIGASVGRFANRIANAQFELNDQKYMLDANSDSNHLHGGISGFDSRIWHAEVRKADVPTVRFSLFSPDGDQGYPGNLTVHITYTLDNSNALTIKVDAGSDADTPISITNHSYFNLAGSGPVLGHWLTVHSDLYTPQDTNQVPMGEYASVADTPFDFRTAKQIGANIDDDHEQIKIGSGYDHNFMTAAAKSQRIELAALLEDRNSGRTLKVFTDAPGLQLYTANFMDGSLGKNVAHHSRHALCLEPQNIPDSPNKPSFPSCILKQGERYQHTMVFECGTL